MVIGAGWGVGCSLASAAFGGWYALATAVFWVPAGVFGFGPMLVKRLPAD